MEINFTQPQLFRKLKLATLICLMLTVANSFAQTYNAPYNIPKFQAFINGCKLQAPTSSTAATNSDLINGYTSSSFYVADVDKMAFNQSGSLNRTELRHETNWNLSTGDQSLYGSIKIVQQTCDQVTVMQIHDDANAGNGPNKPLLRIYKHQTKSPINHLWAAIKTDSGGVNTTHVDLGLAPSEYFNCEIKLVGGNMIINLDGIEKVNMDVSFWTYPSYWKAGVYLQDAGEATAYFNQLYTGTPPVGNNAPSVSVTSPSNGASFNNGANVSISASASDSDGSISQVEFFSNGNSIGVDTTSPYSVNWNIGIGTYNLTAVATDNQSASTTSSAVTVTGNSTAPATNTYVSSISTGTQSGAKGKKHGTATVIILDNLGNPVPNATVNGTFSGTFSQSVSGSTDANGSVEFVTTASAKGGLTVNFCVTGVTHATLSYNSSLNVITCTGSAAKVAWTKSTNELNTQVEMFKVSPNPFVDTIFINLNVENDTSFSARVVDISGKIITIIKSRTLKMGQHKLEVDMTSFAKGIYFLETSLNGEKRVNRVAKE